MWKTFLQGHILSIVGDVLRSNQGSMWISFLFVLSCFVCFLNWCSMGFVYPVIAISIRSFWYCNSTFFCCSLFIVCLFFYGVVKKVIKTFVFACMCDDWKTLQEEHTIRALILVSHKCLKSTLNLTPLSSAHYTAHRPLLVKGSMFE